MRLILSLPTLILILSPLILAAEYPIDAGSNYFGGGFAYNISEGDLYNDTEISEIYTDIFYQRFIIKRAALGIRLDYSHSKMGDLPAVDSFSFGPTAAYFIGAMDDRTLPFVKTGYTFDNNFIGSDSNSGGTFFIGGGIVLLVSNYLTVYNEISYNFESIEGETGRTILFKIGIGGFWYKKYTPDTLASTK